VSALSFLAFSCSSLHFLFIIIILGQMLFLMSLIHLLHPCPSHQGSAAQAQDLTQATFFCLTPAALPIQNELPERAINRLRDYVTAATSQVTSWQRLCLIILVEARSAAIGNC